MSIFLLLFAAGALGVGGVSAYLIKKRKKKTAPVPHPAGKPVAWSLRHLPLLVVTDSPDSRANNIASRCCDEWNRVIEDARLDVKGRMFVFADYSTDTAVFTRPGSGVIPIRFVRDMTEQPHTSLIVDEKGEIRASPIVVPLDASDTLLKQIIRHELGHAIGLPHSEDISSIMYPRALAMSVKVTASEIELLRHLYG